VGRITRALQGASTRRRLVRLTTGGIAAIALGAPGAAGAAVTSEPPAAGHLVNVFPQRDFVSAEGYTGAAYTVTVTHPDGTVRSSVPHVAPVDDPQTPAFDGIIEINHPGGACWDTTTPDIRPGDKVRIVDEATGDADQTTVADVTAQRPVSPAAGVIEVHGTATAPAGGPLPLGELEQRLVVPGDQFALNGRRTLRATSAAGSDGTLSYDAPGSTHWTARYTGLSSDDVTKALGAEARGMWLGGSGTEATIYENGAGAIAGPAAPCTAPLEKLPPPPGSELVPPSAPGPLTATVDLSTVHLSWGPATDNVGVVAYGIYRDGVPVANVQAADGASPPLTAYDDKNLPAGTYTYTVDAEDAVGNRGPVGNAVTVTTTAYPAPLDAVNEPPVLPHSIIAFPARDFVSAEGYAQDDVVAVYVIRKGNIIGSATSLIPQDDPDTPVFDGIVEVNHPGGGCWEGTTPWMLPGDVIRLVTNNGERDQTTIANVQTGRPSSPSPGTVVVHGTAQDAKGNPLPIDALEQRFISSSADKFDLSGRRDLRAPRDAPIAYDVPGGIAWTAKYTGLTDADVTRIVERSEARIHWLGHDPLSGAEATIYENGAAPGDVAKGPAAPCTAPTAFKPDPPAADTTAPNPPTGLTATQAAGSNDVELAWAASTSGDVIGYGVYRDGTLVGELRGDKLAAPLAFTDTKVPGGAHTYTVKAFDEAGNYSDPAEATVGTVDVPPDPNAVNEPPVSPRSVIAFPQRDFVSASGYKATDRVRVDVLRKDANGDLAVVGSTPDLTPVDEPATTGFDGIVEVNHPGGGCFGTADHPNTPNIRPGDKVRLTITNVPFSADNLPDQTTVYDVTAQRPVRTAAGTVEVHGTAVDPATGGPVDIGQLEQRLVTSSANAFALNGKRTLRAGAGADGTLTYDAVGSTKWTATYTGLSADDVTRALASESRAVWLGRSPLVGNELTIYENGPAVAGGPSAPCTAPAATAPGATLSPASLSFADQAPNTTSAAKTVTLTNDGTATLTIGSVYFAGADPTAYARSGGTCGTSLAAGATCTIGVAFTPKAAGATSASVNVADDGNTDGFQSVALSGSGVDPAVPTVTAPVQKVNAPTALSVLSPLSNSTMPVDLTWGGSGTSFELQESVNGGAFTAVALPSADAKSITRDLRLGALTARQAYQYRVRSCSGTTCSAWAPGPKFTVFPVDDSVTQNIAYSGSWQSAAVAGSYGGTVRFATQPGPRAALNKITFTVNGNAAWISTLGPDRGIATVTIDNGTPTTIDTYSPTVKPAQVIYALNGLAPGVHTVTVQVTGTKRAASTGTRVDIDAFMALL
jgi:hypothetical protein